MSGVMYLGCIVHHAHWGFGEVVGVEYEPDGPIAHKLMELQVQFEVEVFDAHLGRVVFEPHIVTVLAEHCHIEHECSWGY